MFKIVVFPHRKFITADVTAVFVNNQHGIQWRGQDFHKKLVSEGTHSKEADRCISWQQLDIWQSVVLISCWKSCGTQAQLTGSQAAADLKQQLIETWSCIPQIVTDKASVDYDYEPASKQRDGTSSTHCNQPALSRATKRYDTTTGSFQSHPHFIKENSYAFLCLNTSKTFF